jgi:molybdopterin molybdotransferase
MAGHIDGTPFVGLPGNPVSAMVCGHVFIAPMIDRMLGLPFYANRFAQARLINNLPPNGPREHYMRAQFGPEGITVENKQDSAFLSVLATSNALVRRAPNDPARSAGDLIDFISI